MHFNKSWYKQLLLNISLNQQVFILTSKNSKDTDQQINDQGL